MKLLPAQPSRRRHGIASSERSIPDPANRGGGVCPLEEGFRLHAVCVRFPHNLSGKVPWQERQPGVYDCRWGTDEVRVIVAGECRGSHTMRRCTCSVPRRNW